MIRNLFHGMDRSDVIASLVYGVLWLFIVGSAIVALFNQVDLVFISGPRIEAAALAGDMQAIAVYCAREYPNDGAGLLACLDEMGLEIRSGEGE